MKKKFPVLKTDEEAEALLEQDLTDYRHHPDWTAPATDAGDHADVEMNP